MTKIFRFFGKLIGAVLVLVFVISSFSSLFLLAFNHLLFDSDFYLEVFEEQEFSDRLPDIAAAQIRYSITPDLCLEDPDQCENGESIQENTEGGAPSYFQALSEDDWEILLTELLPPDWLKDQVMDLIQDLMEGIQTGSRQLAISLSLLDLKEHLSGQSGVDAITQLLKSQPDCSQDDMLEMTRILEGQDKPGKDFLSCNPGDDFLDNYAPQIEVLLTRSLKDIPDEIDLAGGLKGKDATVEAFGMDLPVTAFINFLRWVIQVTPLLNLILLLVIALLAVQAFRGLGVWWGYPLAISGLLGVGLASLVSPVANFILDKFLPRFPLTGLHEKSIDAATGLALTILRQLFSQARYFALIATGIGLAIIITAAVLKDRGTGERERDQKEIAGEDEPIPNGDSENGISLDDEPSEDSPPETAEDEGDSQGPRSDPAPQQDPDDNQAEKP